MNSLSIFYIESYKQSIKKQGKKITIERIVQDLKRGGKPRKTVEMIDLRFENQVSVSPIRNQTRPARGPRLAGRFHATFLPRALRRGASRRCSGRSPYSSARPGQRTGGTRRSGE